MRLVLEGKSVANLFSRYPEQAALLLDFFVWRNDPSAFSWQEQSATWQQTMRLLSFLVWNHEQMAPSLALAAAFS